MIELNQLKQIEWCKGDKFTLVTTGIFANHAIKLDDKYQWTIEKNYDSFGLYLKIYEIIDYGEDFESSLRLKDGSIYILATMRNCGFYIYSKANIQIFNYKKDLLLICL